MIFESNKPWMLSSNGTIFTTEHEGVIPGLLKRWYQERKELQGQLKKAKDAFYIDTGNKSEKFVLQKALKFIKSF